MSPRTRLAAAVASSPCSTSYDTVPLSSSKNGFGNAPITAIVVALVLVNLAGKCGDAFTPVLVSGYPLTLLALNANDVHMACTAGHTSLVPFVLVAFVRRLMEDPLYFYLGRFRFASAVNVFDGITPGLASKVNGMKRWFKQYASIAVLIEPGAVVCLLAGWSKMDRRRFWGINVFGTLARVFLVRTFGVRAKQWYFTAEVIKFAKAHQGVIICATLGVSLIAIASLVTRCVRVWKQNRGGLASRKKQ